MVSPAPVARSLRQRKTRLEQQEQHQEEEEEDPSAAAPAAKLCSHCGALEPGPTASYSWRRHPTTEALLCAPCRRYADVNDGELRPMGAGEDLQPQQQPVCNMCKMPPEGGTPGAGHKHPVTNVFLCGDCWRQQQRAAQAKQQQGERQKKVVQQTASPGKRRRLQGPQERPAGTAAARSGSTAGAAAAAAAVLRDHVAEAAGTAHPVTTRTANRGSRLQAAARPPPRQHLLQSALATPRQPGMAGAQAAVAAEARPAPGPGAAQQGASHDPVTILAELAKALVSHEEARAAGLNIRLLHKFTMYFQNLPPTHQHAQALPLAVLVHSRSYLEVVDWLQCHVGP
ncbi:hypothetical protein D9Q98_003986 [Chlorella vulgaris]|uniref:GATA-type domain-containing protein n=1 Tax=Chlorella vulgaris TaxID=3077 RepID=A0A9D4TR07_CHLVU|nr:hypothetical protein D9Q98_003986 [Chlorella vulgaris]